jgi:DNA replication protein DnaC
MTNANDDLRSRARRLNLHGLLARWSELGTKDWVRTLLDCEEAERQHRSLQRRKRNARLAAFKPIADFDWSWPKAIDRDGIEELFSLDFIRETANVVLIGSNGLGKTMIAQNLGYQALLAGHTVLHVTASEMLTDLATQDSSPALARRLRRYCNPTLLILDEVGYLSFGTRHADLLFEVVNRRHERKPLVLTTNKPFGEWNQVFPVSSCVTALVDRVIHKAEIFKIEGDSYRNKEAQERALRKLEERKARRRKASAGAS